MKLNCLVTFFILALLGVAMADDLSIGNYAPPLIPAGERVETEQPAFEKDCIVAIEKSFSSLSSRMKIGATMMTQNANWGVVWRADYELADMNIAPLINRVVCWRKSDGGIGILMAPGLGNVPPLAP